MMRLCIAFAAAAFIVATVHASPVADEDGELRELLGAVKNYLDKEDDTKATRATACDQPRIFYSSSSVEAQVNAGTGGYWTDWINVDTVQDYGYGEYEDCSRIHWQQNIDKQCLLGCENPLAVKYALVGSSCTATWTDIDNCAGPSSIKVTSCGVKCINTDVQNFARGASCAVDSCPAYGLHTGCSRCPNIRVNFFCAGTKPPTNVCCPYSEGCTKGRSLEHLGETLQEMLDVQERRDVVANILEEVREAIDTDEL